ncbi:hypothetical protein MIND_01093600 [Mycena indigotica]|uniref:Alcohol acetyltransferase n=1 Tax=Mycena indigotica TaxID=2126181 RepID=A0A8H6S9N0_9AGAR|nr:uncharacterized protein MIND_01093600 [Mycena indigotica]KAF7295536.1 hypothetical protein MIND_01093600 [Mycena indigotica]
MSKLQRVRKLGVLEQFHMMRHTLGLDSCVVGVARYTTAERTKLTKEILYPALRAVIESHLALGVRLEKKDNNPDNYFARLPNIDLSRIVQFSESDDLQAALESQLLHGFDTSSDIPLWRLQVLTDNTVLFTFHHVIADGMSSIAFHVQLLRALQKAAIDFSSDPVVHVPPTTTMIPAVDQATRVRPSLSLVVHELSKLILPQSLTAASKEWTAKPTPRIPDLSNTHVRIQSIPPQTIRNLLVVCRANQATLTGAIYVLLGCVVSSLLDEKSKRKYNRVGGLVALSMRGMTGIDDYEICDHPSAVNTSVPLANDFSWNEAARLAQLLKGQKSKGREKIGLLNLLLGRFDVYFHGLLGRKREVGFTLSNIGRWTAPAVEGKWTIGRTMFAQSDVVVGGAFNCSVAGDPTGAVNLTFTWSDVGVETVWMDNLVPLFKEKLSELAEGRS